MPLNHVGQGWDVGIGWDDRFSELLLQPAYKGEKGTVKHVPLAAVLQQFHIRFEELKTAERDAKRISLNSTEQSICEKAIPLDCRGLSVLDIGGYDGRYANLCLERGARAATCVDDGQYSHYGWENPGEKYPDVKFITADFRDLAETYDLVLFFNVIYHLKNPWQAFERLHALTGQYLAVCSLVNQDATDTWRICAPFEVNPQDDTVFWVPSETGLTKLMANVGFQDVKFSGKAGDRLALTARRT